MFNELMLNVLIVRLVNVLWVHASLCHFLVPRALDGAIGTVDEM